MNSPVVIASVVLAVAIVAAAWLLKPIPQPCYENVTATTDAGGTNVNAAVVDRCLGKVWVFNSATGWVRAFAAQTFK